MRRSADLCHTFQHLLTVRADALARETGFLQRARKLIGACFVQTLVFGWLARPAASLSQLQQTAATLGTAVTRQALDQRFRAPAAAFLE